MLNEDGMQALQFEGTKTRTKLSPRTLYPQSGFALLAKQYTQLSYI